MYFSDFWIENNEKKKLMCVATFKHKIKRWGYTQNGWIQYKIYIYPRNHTIEIQTRTKFKVQCGVLNFAVIAERKNCKMAARAF